MKYPNQCHIELTQKCNLNCIHCFANASLENTSEMSLKQFEDVYEQIAELGIIYVNLSGGEPLLNKDFFRIVNYAAKQPYETTLLTNGLLWDETSINKLSEIDSDRKLVLQISLDGPFEVMEKQRLITKPQYYKIINTIKRMKEERFKVTCLIVINSLTAAKSLDTIKYALFDLNVDAVQAIPLFPTGRAAQNSEKLQGFWESWSDFVVEITKIKKTASWGEKSKRVNVGFFTLFELTEPLDNAGMHSDIYDVWGLDISTAEKFKMQTRRDCYCEAGQCEMSISSEMKLYPCVASLRTVFGGEYICNKKLSDLWENDVKLNWFRCVQDKIIDKEPCKNCEYKVICGGGCRIAALEYVGDKYLPDPRCPRVQEYNKSIAEKRII